jgi:hypothetical protein
MLLALLAAPPAWGADAFRTVAYQGSYSECHPMREWHLFVSTVGGEADIALEYERGRDPRTGEYEYTGVAYRATAPVRQGRVRAPLAGTSSGEPDPRLGSVRAELRITDGPVQQRDRVPFTSGGAAVTSTGAGRLSGTLTMPDGRAVGVSCRVERYAYHERARYDNDAAAGAIALPAGAAVVAATSAAAPAAERTCPAGPAYGRTLWYRVGGTGAPVTIDTAGSSFDTVVGVYRQGSSRPIACVDDGPAGAPEAKVRFPTTAGAVYLVQIGGQGDDPAASGILRVQRR